MKDISLLDGAAFDPRAVRQGFGEPWQVQVHDLGEIE